MLRFVLTGVAALVLLTPAWAWELFPRLRQTTTVQYAAPVYSSYYGAPAPAPVVSYYAPPAPVVTYSPPVVTSYLAPAPVYTTYYAAPAPVVSYVAPAPVAVTTTYTYRVPLFPRRYATPVFVVGP